MLLHFLNAVFKSILFFSDAAFTNNWLYLLLLLLQIFDQGKKK